MIESITKDFNIKIENKYTYTQRNLLKFPHKYQYSKFEGNLFFDKIKEDRLSSISFFENRLHKVGINNNILTHQEYKFNTNLILKDFLIYLSNSTNEILIKEKIVIHLLIKRFEVGKKLYLTYDLKEIRKSSLEFEELLNYPLFSLVLYKYYSITKTEERFVYLNAILKVNDIISSVKSDFILSDEIYYSKKAFESELKIIGELI